MMSTSTSRPPRAARDKSQKSSADSIKVSDGNSIKIQPTAEQIRLAQMISDSKDTNDPDMQNKIRQVVELTGKSSDEASVALHDCDNDPNRAINMLLEGDAGQGEWETSIKRKKSRTTTTPQTNVEPSPSVSNNNNSNSNNNNKENRIKMERGRDRDGKERDATRLRGPPRMNRGRGRDFEKNRRNLEDSQSRERSSPDRRGRGTRIINGQSRGGRGGRGGRIRTFQNRGGHNSDFPRSIDTWTNAPSENVDSDNQHPQMQHQHQQHQQQQPPMRVGNWSDDGFPATEDWDNEDWTGSLAETKVFTPSAAVINSNFKQQNLDTPLQQASILLPPDPIAMPSSVRHLGTSPGGGGGSLGGFVQNNLSAADLLPPAATATSSSSSVVQSSLLPAVNQSNAFSSSSSSALTTETVVPLSSGSILSAAAAAVGSMQITPKVLNTQSVGVGSSAMPAITNHHHHHHQQSLPPPRPKPQRGRTPATSKIPSSAVEMPDDAITALDVQFGSLEFGESTAINFGGTTSLQSPASSASSTLANHIGPIAVSNQSASSSPLSSLHLTTSSIAAAAPPTSDLSNGDQSARLGYSSTSAASSSMATTNKDIGQTSLQAPLAQNISQLSGPDVSSFSTSNKSATSSFSVQRTSQSAIDAAAAANAISSQHSKPAEPASSSSSSISTYNVSGSPGGNSFQSAYGNLKVTTSSTFPRHHSSMATTQSQVASALYGGSNNNPVSSQLQPLATLPSSSTFAASSAYAGSQGSSSSSSSAAAQNSNNSYSAAQQIPTYANPGATVSTYASTSSISQTGFGSQSHSSSSLHSSSGGGGSTGKLGGSNLANVKDQLEAGGQLAYDAAANSAPTLAPTLTTTSGSSLSLSSGVLASSNNILAAKSTASASNGKTGVLPPGVPIVPSHQYIMSQTGLPFYSLQQPMYTYEDIQMLQQRMPPMASYYDMSFQPSSNALTGRDSGLTNVAYGSGEGKYSRGDNSSPVPTTLSQQQQQNSTQQHQQAFISPTAAIPHGYSYYYPGGVVTGGFAQYGTPIFPVPPASNSHGATTNTHFQKPNAYGNSHGYTSGYESLGQNQDYGKSSYGSSSQNQKGMTASASGSGNSGSGNDMSASVYNKAHSHSQMMNKQQSYDKPGFHAGTPPPFNLGTQSAGQMGAPPPSTYAAQPFIPMMAQHPSPMMHLHQDSGNAASQRPASTQNKVSTSAKPPAYGPASYWAST